MWVGRQRRRIPRISPTGRLAVDPAAAESSSKCASVCRNSRTVQVQFSWTVRYMYLVWYVHRCTGTSLVFYIVYLDFTVYRYCYTLFSWTVQVPTVLHCLVGIYVQEFSKKEMKLILCLI